MTTPKSATHKGTLHKSSRFVSHTSVSIGKTGLDDADAEVSKDGTVEWTNDTDSPQTVDFPAGTGYPGTNSGPIVPGAKWSLTMPTHGSFPYTVGTYKGTITVS